MTAYSLRSFPLFALEAVIEGVSACLSSGTGSAYLYSVYGEHGYLPRAARDKLRNCRIPGQHRKLCGDISALCPKGAADRHGSFQRSWATVLSAMNIGVNLVGIFSLAAASLLVAAGIDWCFDLCGAALMLCAVLYRFTQ